MGWDAMIVAEQILVLDESVLRLEHSHKAIIQLVNVRCILHAWNVVVSRTVYIIDDSTGRSTTVLQA